MILAKRSSAIKSPSQNFLNRSPCPLLRSGGEGFGIGSRCFANKDFQESGFTLLELIIALSLLGVLLAAGWTLMGTFSQVQQRGWDLAVRTQSMMLTHRWLQRDLQRVIPLSTNPQARPGLKVPSDLQNFQSTARFVGNASGFSVIVDEELNPEMLLHTALHRSREELASTSDRKSGDNRLGGNQGLQSITSVEINPSIEVRYELRASGIETTANQSKEVSTLTRHVYRQANQLRQIERTQTTDTRRELTSADLYRQTDPQQDERIENGVPLKIAELVQPTFSYCDGRQWRSSWDSRTMNRLPTAVALSYDLSSRSVQPVQDSGNRLATSQEVSGANLGLGNENSSVSSPIESPGETAVDQQLPDVRMVVRLDNSHFSATNSQSADASFIPRQPARGER